MVPHSPLVGPTLGHMAHPGPQIVGAQGPCARWELSGTWSFVRSLPLEPQEQLGEVASEVPPMETCGAWPRL